MDVKEKLMELLEEIPYPQRLYPDLYVDRIIANGVTMQECKVAEIGQFKLPIDDAILILKEEYKQRVDGYDTHLSYGGKGDPAEEVYLDALGMAIAALEWQNRTLPQRLKGE